MKINLIARLLLLSLIAVFILTPVACNSDDGPVDPDPIKKDTTTTPTPDPVPTDAKVLAINVGGDSVQVGDIMFVKDTLWNSEPSIKFVNDSIADILGTDMDTIYRTERISGVQKGELIYNIPITNDLYTVKLHFAEIFWTLPTPGDSTGGVGSRVFDVDIEGQVVLNDYDMLKDVAAATAIVKSFIVKVEDESLTIKLDASIDNPKLSAIEILGAGSLK